MFMVTAAGETDSDFPVVGYCLKWVSAGTATVLAA
jgi:hypothetical protein